jgi:hypothetical protein
MTLSALKSLNVPSRKFLAIEADLFNIRTLTPRALHRLGEGLCINKTPQTVTMRDFIKNTKENLEPGKSQAQHSEAV